MAFTRIIAIGAIASLMAFNAVETVQAQSLRSAGPPAEFPPASYKANQYVDSRGCIYIRAGVDGNTTWIPRVTRERKVVCGYKPSLPPGTQTASAAPAKRPDVVQITIEPSAATTAPKPSAAPRTASVAPAAPTASAPKTATAAPKAAAPLPAIFGATGPKPSPGPESTVFSQPEPKQTAPKQTAAVQPAPVTPRRAAPVRAAPSPGPSPTVVSGAPASAAPTTPKVQTAAVPTTTGASPVRCDNASDFSQRYINDGSRHPVRCGPQSETPHYNTGQVYASQATATTNTRVVPRHVYDNRQNTQNVTVPKGYTTVWEDGRLNPKRAERTLAPAQPRNGVALPSGYRMAWEDGRLNPKRGKSVAGNAQTNQIWTQTVPRQLNKVPTDRQVVQNPNPQNPGLPRARTPTRAETKPAAAAPRRAQPKTKPQYIRVATYNTDADARAVAKNLVRRTGLPVRLGTLTRKGKTYRVVMAGPFTSAAGASSAMSKIRGAGYSRARLSK